MIVLFYPNYFYKINIRSFYFLPIMIDEKLQNELRKRYNPDGSILRKMQLRMLQMLIFIDKVCFQYNIEYWLDSGTLLGAARHGGFIPWDDDVDICMTRENMLRFVKIMRKEYKTGQYQIQTEKTDPGYFYHWYALRDTKSEYIINNEYHRRKKFRGLQVDIFPVETEMYPWFKLISQRLTVHKINPLTEKKMPNWLIRIPDFMLRKILFPIFRMYKYSKTSHICDYGYGMPFNMENKVSTVFPLAEIQFEGHTFKCPNNPNEYLRTIYGDWDIIPPENKRPIHKHAIDCIIED